MDLQGKRQQQKNHGGKSERRSGFPKRLGSLNSVSANAQDERADP